MVVICRSHQDNTQTRTRTKRIAVGDRNPGRGEDQASTCSVAAVVVAVERGTEHVAVALPVVGEHTVPRLTPTGRTVPTERTSRQPAGEVGAEVGAEVHVSGL